MRARLEARLFYLSATTRQEAINALLAELDDPTPFMLDAGAEAIEEGDGQPVKARLRWAFRAMISEANKGG